jgi:hypothetical protein
MIEDLLRTADARLTGKLMRTLRQRVSAVPASIRLLPKPSVGAICRVAAASQ